MENLQIIEVNGIKMEVDLRHAKRIDHFKMGDPVKLLVNDGHTNSTVHAGVVVGFEAFTSLPTILVAYIDTSYFGAGLKVAYVNERSRDKYELVACQDNTVMSLDRGSILHRMDAEIDKKDAELRELQQRKIYFEEMFGVYFNAERETV